MGADSIRHTDDEVWRIPYIFHGPTITALVKDVPLRFNGRPAWEWVLLLVAFIALWKPSGWLVADVLGVRDPLLALPCKVVPAFFAASWVGNWAYINGVAGDRSLQYLVRVVRTEIRRVLHQHGPIDSSVAGVGLGVWVFLVVAGVLVGLSGWLWWAGFIAVAGFVARRGVARFGDPNRRALHYFERAERAIPASADRELVLEGTSS